MTHSEGEPSTVQTEIARLLLRHWDPLGVAGQPEGSAAVAGYVDPVLDLLAAKASDRALAEHLAHVETERLGYADSEWRMLVPSVRQLRKLYHRLSRDSPAP
jgi:hypothetical protein